MRSSIMALVVTGVLAGCATTPPPPTIQTGPDAEITIDGLHRVDNSLAAVGYMKPDIDLRGYNAIMLDPVTITYQKDPGSRRTATAIGAGTPNFALTPSQMETLKSLFQEAVADALTEDNGYRIVDTPGPDVLRISADLIDLIVRIPTQPRAGRGSLFVTSYGVVSVIVEARDSESGEILARAADRRDPTTGGGDLVQVDVREIRCAEALSVLGRNHARPPGRAPGCGEGPRTLRTEQQIDGKQLACHNLEWGTS